MNKSKIDYVFDYLNNNDFRYHMEDGTPYKELSMEERDILSTYIIELQQENKILRENAENNDKVVDNVNWENMLLKKKNKQLQERIEYLERSNNRREDTILEQRQEISDLEDNWNKLKEYLFDIRKRGFALQNLANVTKNTEPNISILIIINKMQEMEKNYGDMENNT